MLKTKLLIVALLLMPSPLLQAQTSNTTKSLPAVIGLLLGDEDKVMKIALGGSHTCALLASGAVKCWGTNRLGQVGNGTTDDSLGPAAVLSLRGFGNVSTGSNHTCALTSDNSSQRILCWGDSRFGELSDGTTVSSLVVVSVLNINANIITLSTGSNHNCALLAAGSVKCWGTYGSGQLGNGTQTHSSVPVDVLGL